MLNEDINRTIIQIKFEQIMRRISRNIRVHSSALHFIHSLIRTYHF